MDTMIELFVHYRIRERLFALGYATPDLVLCCDNVEFLSPWLELVHDVAPLTEDGEFGSEPSFQRFQIYEA